MALYEFRCACGQRVEQRFAMSEAPQHVDCPGCAQRARRVISAPRLGNTGAAAYRLIEATERSAHDPTVVSAPAGGARRTSPITNHPLHQRLPRD